ncbi:MAG: hypothetical protein HY958_03955 [Bacteroidia bacterium]|nr:hypothetical protein [Bacteroidia bacterium]
MIAVAGVYNNGIISLFKRVITKKPVNVVVTFLEENAEVTEIKENEKTGTNDFSFLSAIEATKDINISISDALIEERGKEL